jgi:hypothetical protein
VCWLVLLNRQGITVPVTVAAVNVANVHLPFYLRLQ